MKYGERRGFIPAGGLGVGVGELYGGGLVWLGHHTGLDLNPGASTYQTRVLGPVTRPLWASFSSGVSWCIMYNGSSFHSEITDLKPQLAGSISQAVSASSLPLGLSQVSLHSLLQTVPVQIHLVPWGPAVLLGKNLTAPQECLIIPAHLLWLSLPSIHPSQL